MRAPADGRRLEHNAVQLDCKIAWRKVDVRDRRLVRTCDRQMRMLGTQARRRREDATPVLAKILWGLRAVTHRPQVPWSDRTVIAVKFGCVACERYALAMPSTAPRFVTMMSTTLPWISNTHPTATYSYRKFTQGSAIAPRRRTPPGVLWQMVALTEAPERPSGSGRPGDYVAGGTPGCDPGPGRLRGQCQRHQSPKGAYPTRTLSASSAQSPLFPTSADQQSLTSKPSTSDAWSNPSGDGARLGTRADPIESTRPQSSRSQPAVTTARESSPAR